MNKWTKKAVTKDQISPLCSKYNITQLLASILIRRDITEGNDILYYLEDDLRFQHNPFMFTDMEDAVERILQAKEEGEKVLIFGDSDVDGVTSTAILYDQLVRMGIDTSWRVPVGDDGYGLSIEAVDDFYKQDGSLIITVDCGISNFVEIEHANDLGMEVIVTDHHNPPEQLPNAIVIIDPKTEDSGYPFDGISGAAVAYKLVSALRFAESDFYNAEICLLDITPNEDGSFNVDCLKIRNLLKLKELHEIIIPSHTSIYDLKMPYFLQGQLIYVWDAQSTNSVLTNIFGSGIQFNLNDLRNEISKVIPTLRNKTTEQLQSMSTLGKYIEEEGSVINSIYNLYVSYCKRINAMKHPNEIMEERRDLQLVSLAALADIMPMKNENRIFVKNGINSMIKDRPRPGLAELFHKLSISLDSISSIDLSWNVNPPINAAGRMGQADLAVNLLISKDAKEREILANDIYALNENRKELVSSAICKLADTATDSVAEYNNKLCVVIDECINKGVTGIVASRLMSNTGLPSIAITYNDDICIGSMRSCRGVIATHFLDNFGDFFLNHGGHDYAAGFSFKKDKLPEFAQHAKAQLSNIVLAEENDVIEVDAEIPPSFIEPNVFKLLDIFEPYGALNGELLFMTCNFTLCDLQIVGKKEPQHLKLTFDTGKYKIPAMYWGEGERANKDIVVGKKYDILYTMAHNHFNGVTTNQIVIKDCILHE